MSDWTLEKLLRVLDGRVPSDLRKLVDDLFDPVRKGREQVFRRKPWLRDKTRGAEEDDVHAVLEYLFRHNARVLRKFGTNPDFVDGPGALARFVTGVTRLPRSPLTSEAAQASPRRSTP